MQCAESKILVPIKIHIVQHKLIMLHLMQYFGCDLFYMCGLPNVLFLMTLSNWLHQAYLKLKAWLWAADSTWQHSHTPRTPVEQSTQYKIWCMLVLIAEQNKNGGFDRTAVLRGISLPIYLLSPCQDPFSSRVNTAATSLSLGNGKTFPTCIAYITLGMRMLSMVNNTN